MQEETIEVQNEIELCDDSGQFDVKDLFEDIVLNEGEDYEIVEENDDSGMSMNENVQDVHASIQQSLKTLENSAIESQNNQIANDQITTENSHKRKPSESNESPSKKQRKDDNETKPEEQMVNCFICHEPMWLGVVKK